MELEIPTRFGESLQTVIQSTQSMLNVLRAFKGDSTCIRVLGCCHGLANVPGMEGDQGSAFGVEVWSRRSRERSRDVHGLCMYFFPGDFPLDQRI